MARTSSRDVSLTLSIETLGEEGIRKLEDSVRALAKEGGDAGPEFQQLANELARIGEQRDALQAFRAIADETDRLEQRQTEAAGAVQRLTNELTQQAASVTAARTRQSEAAAEVLRLKAALTEATAAVQQNRTGYDAAGNAIDGYKTKTAGLIAEQTKVKLELDKAKEAQREANKEAAAAVTAQTKLAAQLDRAEKSAKGAATAIGQNTTALTEATAAAEKLGVSTANVAQAEGNLLAAFNQVGSAAGRAAQETDEYAEAQDRLKFALQSQQAEADDAARAYAEQSRFIEDAEDAIRGYEQALLEAAAAEDKRIVQSAIAESAWQAEAEAIVDAAEAARRYEREVQLASAAAIELRNIKAFEDQARQAQDLLKAADYVDFWTRSLNEAEAETKQFQGALDRLDVRSVEQIKNEIDQTRQAMATLATRSQQTGESFAGAFVNGEARIKALSREIREVSGALTLADKAADLFRNSIGQITAGNLLADAIGSIVERTKDMGRQFFTVNIEFERLQRALTVVTGSSEAAAAKIEFLRKVANNSGQSISGITDSFIRFQASALSAGIATEKVDSIFQLIVNSGGKLGLTSEQVAGSLEALGQVASKGVLSLEELRQQLGDRFPAALAITARGFGFAENEIGKFVKQVESGSITADEFFNAFKRGVTETFGDSTVRVEGLLASFYRLANAMATLAQDASGSTFFKLLSSTMDVLADNLRLVVDGVYALGKAFLALKFVDYVSGFFKVGAAATKAATDLTVNTTATVTNTTATIANTAAKVAAAGAITASGVAATAAAAGMTVFSTVVTRLQGAFVALGTAARTAWTFIGGPVGVLTGLVVFYKEIGTAVGETAAKFALWAQGAKNADAELARIAAEETKRAEVRRTQDEERELLAARQISKSVEIRKELEKRLAVDQKGVKAAEATAEASRSLAELLGNEANTLKVVAEGATAVADAKQKAATTSAAVVTALEQEIARIDATRDANGRLTSGMEETLKKSRELRDAKIELTTRAQAEAEAAKNNAATQRIAAASYGDLSGKVKELGQAADDARLKLATMSAAGIRDAEQLAAATRSVGEATQVYRKALDDQAKSIKASSDLEQANYNIKLSGLNIRKTEIEQQAEVARASGRLREAVELEIEAKRIQIQILEVSTKAKALELEADKALVLANREQLIQLGQFEGAKKAEIESRLKAIEVKQLELKLSGIQAQGLRDEIELIRRRNAALAGGIGPVREHSGHQKQLNSDIREGTAETLSFTEAGREAAGTWERLAAAGERAAAAAKAARYDAQGFAKNTAGQTISAGGALTTRTGIADFLRSAGVSNEDDVRRITAEFSDQKGDIPFFNNPGQVRYKGNTMSDALLKAAEKITFGSTAPRVVGDPAMRRVEEMQAKVANLQAGTTGLSTAEAQQVTMQNQRNASPSTQTLQPVNITINGRTRTVNVGSRSDADALADILRQLEEAAGAGAGP